MGTIYAAQSAYLKSQNNLRQCKELLAAFIVDDE